MNDTNRNSNDTKKRLNRRYTINDVLEEDGPHVFVRNNAPKMVQTVAHLLIPYTSSQTGDQKSIEVPMTHIPFDLADYTPKEELMRNPELRHIWNQGFIEFVPSAEARKELESDDALAEQDRLFTMRQTRNRATPPVDALQQNAQRQAEANAQQQSLQPVNPGDFERESTGVNTAVANAMQDETLSDSHRLSLLKNLEPMMSDIDRRFIRSKTEDAAIRKLVG